MGLDIEQNVSKLNQHFKPCTVNALIMKQKWNAQKKKKLILSRDFGKQLLFMPFFLKKRVYSRKKNKNKQISP